MKTFNTLVDETEDGMKCAVRASQLWPYLIGKAKSRSTVIYSELNDLMGYEHHRLIGTILGRIAYYCEENNLPPLSILAVSDSTGKPGPGFTIVPAGEHDRNREVVFAMDWYTVVPPTADQLQAAFDRATHESQIAA